MAYKTLYSENYYRESWDRLFAKYRKDWDFEADLRLMVPGFEELPEEARELAKKTANNMMAQRIAKTATEDLQKRMAMIQRIRNGEAGLGGVSKKQDIERWHDIQEGFEFACLQLADFRKKYGVD